MERPTARKVVVGTAPASTGANTNSCSGPRENDDIRKRQRRRVKPASFKFAILSILFGRNFYRAVLVIVNVTFFVALFRVSSNSSPSLRLATATTLTDPFPPLRKPIQIERVHGNSVMSHAGYHTKPQVIGAYFRNQTSRSFQGTQILPTRLLRRLTHHFVEDPMSPIGTQIQIQQASDDYEEHMRDSIEYDSCEAPFEWMKRSFPTCNTLHEQDLSRLHESTPGTFQPREKIRLIAAGFWRDVWRIQPSENLPRERVVLKTMRYVHEFDDRNFDRHRRDALAMDRLTWSPNVIDIYAFCGNSGIFEYAGGGTIEDMIDYEQKEFTWNSTERLLVAFQVAAALAATHNSERDGIPAIAHADVMTSQFVHVENTGLYKLNDFNRCRFIATNTVNGRPCTFTVSKNPGTFRSPEEYAYWKESEKIDIYSMGNIFYVLLTATWPFQGEDSKDAQRKLIYGKRPPIDDSVRDSSDPALKALNNAMDRCWDQNPQKRPKAVEVRDYIEGVLRGLLGQMPESISLS